MACMATQAAPSAGHNYIAHKYIVLACGRMGCIVMADIVMARVSRDLVALWCAFYVLALITSLIVLYIKMGAFVLIFRLRSRSLSDDEAVRP